MKSLLREPLLHFTLIGAAFFLGYHMKNDAVPENDSARIVITQAQIDRLSALWEKQRQRLPTQEELDGLIEYQVREEVLYREALVMGLDKNDAGVRRRLAQKVNFIFSDIIDQAEPSDDDLTAYLQSNPEQFEIPGQISFSHIYFNTDKRGKQAVTDARQLLAELAKSDSAIDTQLAGDRSMLGYRFQHLAENEVISMFGKPFSSRLFDQSIGDWQGPIASSYGVHLVKIEHKKASMLPGLEAVKDKVRNAWFAEQRQKLNDDFYQKLRQQYQVVIERESVATL